MAKELSVKLLLTFLLLTGHRSSGQDFCSSFHFLNKMYEYCISEDGFLPQPPLDQLDTVQGEDIIVRLDAYCNKVPTVRTCLTDMSRDLSCDEDTQNAIASAGNRSAALCEETGGLKEDIRQIFQSEAAASPEKTTKAICHAGLDHNDCIYEAKEKFGFENFDIRTITIQEMFATDVQYKYFNDIFQCARTKITSRCPENAISMTVAYYPFVVVPPRFGIDVYTILLNALTPIGGD